MNAILMEEFRLPWSSAQAVARCLIRVVGDASWLLQSFPRLSAYRLTGVDWTVVFVGQDYSLRAINQLLFDQTADSHPLGRVAWWELSACIHRWLREGASLVVCELSRLHPRPPRAALTFTALPWVQQILALPESLPILIMGNSQRGLRNKINRAYKAGFTYRFSQSPTDFDVFYQSMYVPFVKKRHTDMALVTPYSTLRRWLTKGGLVLVCQSDKPVAGALCHLVSHTYYSLEGGIWQADPHLFQQGIHAFNTWCEMVYARSQGARLFDMGGSRAWRSDGPFAYKRLWGARVARRKRIYGEWTFLARDLPRGLETRINQLGLITELKGKFLSVVLRSEAALAEAEDDQLQAAAQSDGLDGVIVITANAEPSTRL